jgi:hypothetical protein
MNNIFRKVNLDFRIGRAKITNFLQITKSFVLLMAVFAAFIGVRIVTLNFG